MSGTDSLQLATPTLGLCLATLGLLHTGGPSRACQFQPSQPADLLDLVGQLWRATAAQRMPKAEAGGLFRLGARLGARNFPERTVPFAHSQGAKTFGFPWKIPSRARNPWAVAAPPGPRPGTARRPRARPDHLPYRGAGRRTGRPGPGGAPSPRWRAPRGPATAYSPSRVARGGAGRLRAQLRSARRTGWRRGGSARPGPCPRRGAGLGAGKSACWEAGARAPAWGGEGGRTRLRTLPGSRAGSRQTGERAGWRRRKGWGDPAYGRGRWPPTRDGEPAEPAPGGPQGERSGGTDRSGEREGVWGRGGVVGEVWCCRGG